MSKNQTNGKFQADAEKLGECNSDQSIGRVPPDCLPNQSHSWLIAIPNGPTSRGFCSKCEGIFYFPNSQNDTLWSKQKYGRKIQRRNRKGTY